MKTERNHVLDLREPKLLLLWLAAREELDKMDAAGIAMTGNKNPNQKRNA